MLLRSSHLSWLATERSFQLTCRSHDALLRLSFCTSQAQDSGVAGRLLPEPQLLQPLTVCRSRTPHGKDVSSGRRVDREAHLVCGVISLTAVHAAAAKQVLRRAGPRTFCDHDVCLMKADLPRANVHRDAHLSLSGEGNRILSTTHTTPGPVSGGSSLRSRANHESTPYVCTRYYARLPALPWAVWLIACFGQASPWSRFTRMR
ncbi:hypothetical protein OH77DRAFT_250405 [Trametes cingulata]|nr:hypothetical protein OH77DRAFT_250405 [Trametes cingulata]